MANSTENDTNKTISTLELRTRKMALNKLTPKVDAKVWGQAIKKQTEGMEDSIKKCDIIIKALGELQKGVKACNDQL